MFNLVTSLSHT